MTSPVPMESPFGMAFVAVVLTLMCVLIVVAVWQGFKTWQIRLENRANIARDEAYRKLAEEATATQASIARDLADLRQRVAAIEKILSTVD